MKKEYTAPELEKVEFNYQNVVASSAQGGEESVEVGKHNANACFTHNTNNVNTGCIGIPKT